MLESKDLFNKNKLENNSENADPFVSAGDAVPVPDSAPRGEEHTDLGNAKRLVKRHGKDIRYVAKMKAWFIWEEGFWRRDESGAIYRLAQDTVEATFNESTALAEPLRTERRKFALKSQSRSALEAMVALAQHQIEVVLSPKEMNTDPYLLGVLNGVVDLRTGTFREGRREDYITLRANVRYDAAATCPNWLAFQEKIAQGDKGVIAYKQRMFGLSLSGLMEEVVFIMYGEGSNGKSTEGELFFRLMGDYSVASDKNLIVSSDRSSGGPTPEIVRLKDMRVNFVNELEESDHFNESRIKFTTSQEHLAGRGLFEGIISFAPTHKTFIRTNHKPRIRGTDLGIWRRVHFIPYLVTFKDEEKIDRFREKHLDPEAAGILNWMIAGFKEYQQQGLNPPAVICAANDSYRTEMNSAKQWITVALKRGSDLTKKLTLKALHRHYEIWMENEKGFRGVSNKKLGEALRAEGFESKMESGVTVFEGLEFAFEHKHEQDSGWERAPF